MIPGLDCSEKNGASARAWQVAIRNNVDQGSSDQLRVLLPVENHTGFSPFIFDEDCKS